MKVEKAPLESYADVGGLTDQIQEVKESRDISPKFSPIF
jgi:26S proteasome regulatory subunit T2